MLLFQRRIWILVTYRQYIRPIKVPHGKSTSSLNECSMLPTTSMTTVSNIMIKVYLIIIYWLKSGWVVGLRRREF